MGSSMEILSLRLERVTKKKKNYACIILSGYNATQIQNRLVCKQTFYHLANLFAMP